MSTRAQKNVATTSTTASLSSTIGISRQRDQVADAQRPRSDAAVQVLVIEPVRLDGTVEVLDGSTVAPNRERARQPLVERHVPAPDPEDREPVFRRREHCAPHLDRVAEPALDRPVRERRRPLVHPDVVHHVRPGPQQQSHRHIRSHRPQLLDHEIEVDAAPHAHQRRAGQEPLIPEPDPERS